MPTGSRILFACLGLALIMIGGGGTVWLWRSYQHALETRSWLPVEALIVSSEVLTDRATPHSPLRYTTAVRYRYTIDGRTHTGSRVKRVDGPSSHKRKAESLAETYRTGKTVTCYVKPAEPDFAILEHASLAALYSIWFPLLFVAGGGGMLVSAVRRPVLHRP